jgi:DNA-binding MarR family transcriptional regulator
MSDPFDLSDFMPYRLAVLAERVSRRLSEEYGRSHGLTVAEWRVLVHLKDAGQVSIRDIQGCVNLEKPRVSRAVSRLERAGLVRKEAARGDGRLVSIALTGDGEAALAEILPAALEVERSVLAGLRPEEIEAFTAVMDKIHQTLDDDPLARSRSRPKS